MRAMVPEGGNEVSAMGDRAMAAAQQPGKGDGEAGAGKRLEPIRVLIADDHALFRRGLEMVLEEEDDIDLVGQASDGTEAARNVAGWSPAAALAAFSSLSGLMSHKAVTLTSACLSMIWRTDDPRPPIPIMAVRSGPAAEALRRNIPKPDATTEAFTKTLRSMRTPFQNYRSLE